jgi:hypothetical protein
VNARVRYDAGLITAMTHEAPFTCWEEPGSSTNDLAGTTPGTPG